MNGFHKVRFVTHGTETHVFLDDQEVHGCTSACFAYQIDALPIVHLELITTDVDVEAEQAMVETAIEEKNANSNEWKTHKTGGELIKFIQDNHAEKYKVLIDDPLPSAEMYTPMIIHKHKTILFKGVKRNE